MLSDYERGTIVSLVKWVSISAVVLGAIWWFSYMMYAPHQKLSHEQMAAFEKPRLAVAGVLQEYLVEARKARSDTGLEQALGDLIGQPEASKESSRTDDFFTPIPTGIPGARITVYDQLGTPRSIPETDLRAALGGGYSLTKPHDETVRHVDTGDALRVDPRGGNNLVIYLRRTDFEIVPYPDRPEFVKAVGKAWCDNTGEDSHWFLPTVYIGDIRTGEELATYDCVHWSDVFQ